MFNAKTKPVPRKHGLLFKPGHESERGRAKTFLVSRELVSSTVNLNSLGHINNIRTTALNTYVFFSFNMGISDKMGQVTLWSQTTLKF